LTTEERVTKQASGLAGTPTGYAPGMGELRPDDRGRPSLVLRARSLGVWLAIRLYPLALIVGVWQLLVTLGLLSPFVLPSPAAVLERGLLLWEGGRLQVRISTTVSRVITAYGLAVMVGVTVGMLMGRLRYVRAALRPIVSYLFPTPKIAIYPAMLIILGLGTASKVALGFAEAVFPILLATAAATSQVEPKLLWSARALGTPERRAFLRVVLPASLPGVLTGARIGLIGAIIGVYIGEMIAGGDGLGNMMVVGWRLLRTADMYVSIVVIAAIGLVLDRLFLAGRRRVLVWSDEGAH
jgi:ABC-type nitrate/sulfonate/bicarbonate transport system permease component